MAVVPPAPGAGVPHNGALHDEAALAASLARRDERALAVLFDRHGSACYALARRIVVDEALAQDVVQEAFLGVWRGAASYDPSKGTLRTWLFTLVHHRAVDLVRKENRHRSRSESLDGLDLLPSGETSVEDQADAGVRAGHVRDALGALPPPQRDALLLAYFGGYTQSEIADLTGSPLGTVKTRMFTGMRTLRRVLGPAVSREG